MADTKIIKELVLSDDEKKLVLKKRLDEQKILDIKEESLKQKKILEEELNKEYSDKELIELGKQFVENKNSILRNEIYDLEN